MWKFAVGISILTFSLGCNGNQGSSPTGASAVNNSGVRSAWDPYLGMHPFDTHNHSPQEGYLDRLVSIDMVRGVRMDIPDGALVPLVNRLMAQQVDVLGIFPDQYLREDNAPERFIALARMYPQVKVWEVGNEVGLFVQMSPEEYVPIYLRIYAKAKRELPNLEILPQPPASGEGAVRIFGKMLDLGVLDLANNPDPSFRLGIVSLHFYSDKSTYIYEMKSQLERLPADTEVWVTEAGINRWSDQVQFVEVNYPRLRGLWRASRIYWYVLAECSEFALVSGLPPQCANKPQESPLFQALVQ